jgi:hypothetical protein
MLIKLEIGSMPVYMVIFVCGLASFLVCMRATLLVIARRVKSTQDWLCVVATVLIDLSAIIFLFVDFGVQVTWPGTHLATVKWNGFVCTFLVVGVLTVVYQVFLILRRVCIYVIGLREPRYNGWKAPKIPSDNRE